VFAQLVLVPRDEPRQQEEEQNDVSLEQHASWQNRLKDIANITQVIITRRQMGPISIERLHFNPELTRFTDLVHF
jgi:replicative DNA helicase